MIFTFTPNSNLSSGTVYKVKVTTGVEDGSGNSMASDSTTSSGFTIVK